MKKLVALMAAASVAIPSVYANNAETDTLREEILLLKQQLQALEQRLSQQEQTSNRLEATAQVMEEKALRMEEDSLSMLNSWAQLKEMNDRLSISGTVAVLGQYAENDSASGSDEDESDIIIDQVRLNIAIDVTDNVQGFVALQYEDDLEGNTSLAGGTADTEDSENIELDEAWIRLGGTADQPLYLVAGKQYMPFSNIDNYGHFINDSLVRQLSETRDTGVTLGYAAEGLDIAVFAYNGQVDSNDGSGGAFGFGDNQLEHWGSSLSYSVEEEDYTLALGAGYTSNLYEAVNAFNNAPFPAGSATGVYGYEDQLSAWNAFVVFQTGPLWLSGEVTRAFEDVDPKDLGTGVSSGDEATPEAYTLEAAFTFPVGDNEWTLAGKYEAGNGSNESKSSGTKEVYGLGLSTEIFSNTALIFNYEFQQYEDAAEEEGHAHLYMSELVISF